jgi:long-chain acyl-CoA synthetase
MMMRMRENLATLVEDFRLHAAETAVVTHRGVRRYVTTYGELASLAGRFAAELERRGIGPGERVVIWGADSAEWIGVFFGCLLRGVLAVPLDAAGSAEFAERVIRDVRARLVVGDAGLLASLGLPVVRSTLSVEGGALRDGERTTKNVERLALTGIGAELPAEPLWAVSDAVTEEAAFQIVFTSGTTSEPKGIVHTHRNVLVTLRPIEAEMGKYRRVERVFHPLRFLHSLPLSHVFGQFMGLWCPALLAAEVHFAEQLEPSRMVELIRRERISVLVAVPRVLGMLRTHLSSQFSVISSQKKQTDGELGTESSQLTTVLKKWWRYRRVHRALGWKFWAVISGGATLPAELESFWNGMGFALIQGYGMTETAALVTLNHPFHIAPGTIGKTLPGREVRIGEDGEILVRGEMLAGSTWQGGAMHRREGEWLATGDLAEENAAGEFKFLGRKGDVIVTSAGLNIHPADLETAMTAQPGVRGCVVVSCDFNAGPEAVATVLFSGSDEELDAAVTAANRGLAEYQQVRHVVRWPELEFPYTSTGKVVRRRVAEWVCGRVGTVHGGMAGNLGVMLDASGSFDSGQDDGAFRGVPDALLKVVAGVTGERVAGGDSLRLSEDLHLDSLGRVEVQAAVEQRFGVELEDDAVAAVGSVGELRALVEREVVGRRASARDGKAVTNGAPSVSPLQKTGSPGSHVQEPAASDQRSAVSGAGKGNPPFHDETVKGWATRVEGEHLYPRWPWWWWVRWVRVVWIELVMRPLVWLLARPKVVYEDEGRTNAGTPRSAHNDNVDGGEVAKTKATTEIHDGVGAPGFWAGGPFLVICNHVTAYDGAMVLYALPGPVRRRVAAAMSGEMLLDYRRARGQGNWALSLLAPGAYWLLTALFNVFPLPRARGFRRSFAHAGEAMDHGYSVLIFPEGTRSKTGAMGPFRSGIGLLARETEAPILPVALRGLGVAQGEKARGWFHSGKIEVRVGRVVQAANDATDAGELTERLEEVERKLVHR